MNWRKLVVWWFDELAPILIPVALALVLALGLKYCHAAEAQPQAKPKPHAFIAKSLYGTVVRISHERCPEVVPGTWMRLGKAIITYADGRSVRACWYVNDAKNKVIIIDEQDGSHSVDIEAFAVDPNPI